MASCFLVHNIKISLKLLAPSLSYFNEIITKNKKIKQKKTSAIFIRYIQILLTYFLIHLQIFYTVTLPKLITIVKYFHPKKN